MSEFTTGWSNEHVKKLETELEDLKKEYLYDISNLQNRVRAQDRFIKEVLEAIEKLKNSGVG